VGEGDISAASLESLKESFHRIHERLYGYHLAGEEMEIVYLRLAALGRVSKPEFFKADLSGEDARRAFKETRPVYMDYAWVDTAVYDRALLAPGNVIQGPAIIEQFDSTTLVKSGQTARVDEYMNLMITL